MLLQAVKSVISKISDRFFGVDFVELVFKTIQDGGESSDQKVIPLPSLCIKSCVKIEIFVWFQTKASVLVLPLLADINPRLFWNHSDAIGTIVLECLEDPEVRYVV
jgi:hypothetical protein